MAFEDLLSKVVCRVFVHVWNCMCEYVSMQDFYTLKFCSGTLFSGFLSVINAAFLAFWGVCWKTNKYKWIPRIPCR